MFCSADFELGQGDRVLARRSSCSTAAGSLSSGHRDGFADASGAVLQVASAAELADDSRGSQRRQADEQRCPGCRCRLRHRLAVRRSPWTDSGAAVGVALAVGGAAFAAGSVGGSAPGMWRSGSGVVGSPGRDGRRRRDGGA